MKRENLHKLQLAARDRIPPQLRLPASDLNDLERNDAPFMSHQWFDGGYMYDKFIKPFQPREQIYHGTVRPERAHDTHTYINVTLAHPLLSKMQETERFHNTAHAAFQEFVSTNPELTEEFGLFFTPDNPLLDWEKGNQHVKTVREVFENVPGAEMPEEELVPGVENVQLVQWGLVLCVQIPQECMFTFFALLV